MLRYYSTDIVNVRMIITEEKILSTIDKISRQIDPNSKKTIIQLSTDKNFKENIESIKTYINEYPNKKTFPTQVYVEAFKLVQKATTLFEEHTKKIEALIRQREENIILAGIIKEVVNLAVTKSPNVKEKINSALLPIPDVTLKNINVILKCKDREQEECQKVIKELKVQVANLESNAHIEIDIERLEDRVKALSLIGVGLATELKQLPLTEDKVKAVKEEFEKMQAKQQQNKVNVNVNAQLENRNLNTVKPTRIKASVGVNPIVSANVKQSSSNQILGNIEQEKEEIMKNTSEQEIYTNPVINQKINTQGYYQNLQYNSQGQNQYIQNQNYVQNNQQNYQGYNQNYVRTNSNFVNNNHNYNVNGNNNYYNNNQNNIYQMEQARIEQIRQNQSLPTKKPSLWQKIKNSKIGRAIAFIFNIRIVVEVPKALPEGRG